MDDVARFFVDAKQRGHATWDSIDELLKSHPDFSIQPLLAALEEAGLELREPAGAEVQGCHEQVVQVYLDEMARVPALSREREAALGRLALDGSEIAKRDLVEPNLGMVIEIAERFPRDGIHILDLIQEGNIGLMEAVNSFDRSGCRFSHYAYWCVRKRIRAYRAISFHSFS